MRTGIRASVAPRTTGSSGVWTRPDSSCFHIPARFAARVVEPPESRTCLTPLRRPRPAHESLGDASHDRRRLRSSARAAAARRFAGIAARRGEDRQALARRAAALTFPCWSPGQQAPKGRTPTRITCPCYPDLRIVRSMASHAYVRPGPRRFASFAGSFPRNLARVTVGIPLWQAQVSELQGQTSWRNR